MLTKESAFPYPIRWAKPGDWEEMMNMVWETFLKFEGSDYTQEGIDSFWKFITDRKLFESFLRGKYQVMVALDDAKIVGMASLRNQNHLSLLFVNEVYHNKGVGSTLMKEMCTYLSKQGIGYMMLAAAPYAVRFYEKLGFRVVRPEEQHAGIRVTLMEKYF